MIRYLGQTLPPHSRIAVIANDAIGNFVVVTPLLQMLREQWKPKAIDFFSGPRTSEFQSNNPLIDSATVVFGQSVSASVAGILHLAPTRRYDLVINVERSPFASTLVALLATESTFVVGPCIGQGGREVLPFGTDEVSRLWQDEEWIAPNLLSKYPQLKTPFIGEIFCRLCYLQGEIPPYSLPSADPCRPIPDVLIATAASLDEKLWPVEKWLQAIDLLVDQGLTVGLLGAKPSVQNQHWLGASAEDQLVASRKIADLRGVFTLPQVVGAIDRCRLVLSLDNGIMHLAAAVNKPTIALFRPGIHRLWAPPSDCLRVVLPQQGDLVSKIDVAAVMKEVTLAI